MPLLSSSFTGLVPAMPTGNTTLLRMITRSPACISGMTIALGIPRLACLSARACAARALSSSSLTVRSRSVASSHSCCISDAWRSSRSISSMSSAISLVLFMNYI